MMTSMPQLIEDIWNAAPPGREMVAVNELMRAVRRMIEEDRRPNPRFITRRHIELVRQ
jgi:hypothetical protein